MGRQGGFDGGCDFRRIGGGGRFKAGYEGAVAANEEFGEVPLDFAAEFGVGGFAGEEVVERGLVVAFDGDFGHHWEADVVFLGAEGFDLFVGAWFLAHEVIGGDADDDQALVFVLFVEGFERRVLRGVAALAGDVDEHDYLAVIFGERGGLAVNGFESEVVDGFWCGDGGCGEGECEAEESEFAHGELLWVRLRIADFGAVFVAELSFDFDVECQPGWCAVN